MECSIIFVINVSADTYNELFDTNISASGQFFDYSSNTNAGTAIGYLMDYSSIGYDDYYFVTPTNPSKYTLGTYGMSLVQCGLSFLKDNYYSVSYYFIGNGTYVHPYYTSLSYKLGLGTTYNNSNYLNFNYDTVSEGVEQFQLEDGVYLMVFTNIFKAYKNSTCVSMAYSSQNNSLNSYYAGFVGYKYSSLGSKPLSSSDIQNALTQNFTNIENKINDMKTEQQATNDKLDEITDMDISEEDKELPDDSSYQDYTDAEGDLIDKVNSADMDSLDIAIDTDTSNFIWDTITDLFNSHPMIMSTIIAILSIGVIKLALGR